MRKRGFYRGRRCRKTSPRKLTPVLFCVSVLDVAVCAAGCGVDPSQSQCARRARARHRLITLRDLGWVHHFGLNPGTDGRLLVTLVFQPSRFYWHHSRLGCTSYSWARHSCAHQVAPSAWTRTVLRQSQSPHGRRPCYLKKQPLSPTATYGYV